MRRVFRHVITGLVSILLDAIILSSRLQAGRGREAGGRRGGGREAGGAGGELSARLAPPRGSPRRLLPPPDRRRHTAAARGRRDSGRPPRPLSAVERLSGQGEAPLCRLCLKGDFPK